MCNNPGKTNSKDVFGTMNLSPLLSAAALLIQLVLGMIFGIISAIKAGKPGDDIIRFICVFLASVPGFVIGMVLLSVFAVSLNLYEISGSLP
jgi:peptide/nickel transport system permease protein